MNTTSIIIGIEFASSKLQAAYRVKDSSKIGIVKNWAKGRAYNDEGEDCTPTRMPLAVNFLEDGQFDIGYFHNGNGVFGLKSALDDRLSTSGDGRRFRGLCEKHGLMLDDLLVRFFEEAKKTIQGFLDTKFPSGWEWEKTHVTVPVLWTQTEDKASQDIQRRLLLSMEKAGVPGTINFDDEVGAIGANLLQSHNWKALLMRESHVLVLVDLGQETWDYAVWQWRDGSGFVLVGNPQGGPGGAGKLWRLLKERITDQFAFLAARQKFFSMQPWEGVQYGKEELSKVEVQKLFEKAYESALKAFDQLLQSVRHGHERVYCVGTGAALASNPALQKLMLDIATKHEVTMQFTSSKDTRYLVVKGSIVPWDKWEPIQRFTDATFGVVISDSAGEGEDLVLTCKSPTHTAQQLEPRFDSIYLNKNKVQGEPATYSYLYPVYTTIKDEAKRESPDTARDVLPSHHATLMDPIEIPELTGGSNAVHFRFQPGEKNDKLILECFCSTIFIRIPLKITRERWRILLEEQEGRYHHDTTHDLMHLNTLSIRVGKASAKFLWTEEGCGIDIFAKAGQIEVLCPHPVLASSLRVSAPSTSKGFFTLATLQLPKLKHPTRCRLGVQPDDDKGRLCFYMHTDEEMFKWNFAISAEARLPQIDRRASAISILPATTFVTLQGMPVDIETCSQLPDRTGAFVIRTPPANRPGAKTFRWVGKSEARDLVKHMVSGRPYNGRAGSRRKREASPLPDSAAQRKLPPLPSAPDITIEDPDQEETENRVEIENDGQPDHELEENESEEIEEWGPRSYSPI